MPPGARLGPYEILSPLGAGGMGEVYKARDTRLDRIVAIKILPTALAADPQFRQRFDREARTISGLDHPHICALYDVGEVAPTGASATVSPPLQFLVMQFLEGETLADRLKTGPLPIAEAIALGVQVADALHRAHRAGIVHRDLKPGNVMLTRGSAARHDLPDAKLLDFGLAKTTAGAAVASHATMMPTTPATITSEGTILGTFQYMAPEQIEGQEVDARSDIFALGAMLYEMLTGRTAFSGKTRAGLMSAILKDEPPPLRVEESLLSPALDRVVRTCLAKDPDDRWQTAREVERELRWLTQDSGRPAGAASADRPRAVATRRWLLAVAVAVAATLALVALLPIRAPRPAPRIQFTIEPPPHTEFPRGSGATPWPIVSPDGARVVFGAVDDRGGERLWMRDLATADLRVIGGTEGAEQPFWSPDGRAIGFFVGHWLKRVELAAGNVQTVCEVTGIPRKGSWNHSGVILYATGGQPLSRVSANGGIPQPATTLDAARRDKAHLYPSFLPDGRHFLFLAETADVNQSVILVGSLDSEGVTSVVTAHSESQYADPGYLLYVRDGTLLAQPFDARRSTVTGEPTVAVASVSYTTSSGIAAFSTGPGVLVYRAGAQRAPQSTLTWRDRQGRLLQSVGEVGGYHNPEASPDGRVIAVERLTQNSSNLWVFDVARGVGSRLTFSNSVDFWPLWSPDGGRIAFMSSREGAGRFSIYVRTLTGAATESLVVRDAMPLGWAPDGAFLLCTPGNPLSGGWTILAKCPLAGGTPEPLMRFESSVTAIAFSPDGKWLAYVSEESGRPDVYVRRYPSGADRTQVSISGGAQPRWRPDMRELFYLAPDGKLMATALHAGATLDFGTPQLLFEVPRLNRLVADRQQYTTTDGQRFLLNEATEAERGGITAVVNWAAAIGKTR